MIHIWAVLSFLNFVGWGIRNRKYDGWSIGETLWYDTVIGVFAACIPVAASTWFMYSLLTCDIIIP
jgi:hypothetical protein